jgi:hypothetical protein
VSDRTTSRDVRCKHFFAGVAIVGPVEHATDA